MSPVMCERTQAVSYLPCVVALAFQERGILSFFVALVVAVLDFPQTIVPLRGGEGLLVP